MKNSNDLGRRGRRLLLSRLTLGALLTAPLLTGCDLDQLLEVDDDFTIDPGVAGNPANLDNTFAGAASLFGTAVGGWSNNIGGIVMHTGLGSDELYSTDNFNNRWSLDRHEFDYENAVSESDDSFIYLQRARATALSAAGLFAESEQSGGAAHAELYNIAAYSTLMLAENYCSGIPLSRVAPDGDFEYGSALPASDVYDRAIALFDSAQATAPNAAKQVNTARVGKARALLGKGEFNAAAAAAAQVPGSFGGYFVEFDALTQRTENAVFQFNWDERRISATRAVRVPDPDGEEGDSIWVGGEGTLNRGLPFATEVDPRTPIDPEPLVGNSGTEPVYLQLAYPDGDSDIALATAYEARYIQAEAALRAGQVSQFESFLNEARQLQGLAPLSTMAIGTTTAAREDTLFRERAYAMWLTGHRYSDLRRLVRQYGRPIAEVFPTGKTVNDLDYGTDIPFPIPFEEVNNPNVTSNPGLGVCINTDA